MTISLPHVKRKLSRTNLLWLLFILAVAALMASSGPRPTVRLYDVIYSPRDLQAISTALLECGIPNQVTREGMILVPQARLWDARVAMVEAGLPRYPSIRTHPATKHAGSTLEAHREEAIRQRYLEGDLTAWFRELPGVRDAQVKLARPKKGYYIPPEPTPTCRVLLDLDPGYTPSVRTLGGMVRMVAASTPELLPGNVTIIDTSGRELTALARGQQAP